MDTSSDGQSDGSNDGSAKTNEDEKRLLSLDARDLSELIQTGQATALQLMEATLRRIDEVNPTLNAIVNLRDRDELLAEARAADAVPPNRRLGWLHGVPIAVKDLANARGLPTTFGSVLFSDVPPATEDDVFVRNIRNAGAIVIGKTNVPEFGKGSHTYNGVFGRTRNPYDPSRSAGGSSGGAAAALAAGMVSVADGSDMMGSLRNPAGWNGLYSHRPTAGMVVEAEAGDSGGANDGGDGVAGGNGDPLPWPLATAGPMGRNPLDVAMLLQTMAGADLFDASVVPSNPKMDGARIGWLGDWGGAYAMEPGILSLCTAALEQTFGTKREGEGGGCTVARLAEVPFPAEELWKSWTTIRSVVVAESMTEKLGRGTVLREGTPVKPEVIWEVKRGMAMAQEDVREAIEIAHRWAECAETMFERYDCLALPTAQVWPFPVQWDWPKAIAGKDMDTYHRWMEVVVPVSLAGLPCVTVPAGFGDEGLPMGMQLFGPRGSDARLLCIAQFYHQRFDWSSEKHSGSLAVPYL